MPGEYRLTDPTTDRGAGSTQQHTGSAHGWLGSLTWRDLLGIAVAMSLIGLLSVYQLGAKSFWRDEVSSVVFASGSVPDLLTIIGRDREKVGLPNMATYYLVLHFWLAFGETEARIRFLSVLAGVATVIPVFFLARRLGGPIAATSAALLFAVSPFVILWSREARGYSLAMLATMILTWILVVAVERRSLLLSALYGVIAALAVYVHFFMVFVLVAHVAWVLLPRPRAPLRQIALAALPIIVALAPLPFVYAEHGGQHDWIPAFNLKRVFDTLTTLAGGEGLLVVLTALAATALAARRSDPVAWLIAMTAVGPILLTLAFVPFQNLLLARYLVIIIPAVAVLAGAGLVWVRPPYLRALTAVGLAVLVAVGLPSAYADTRQQDWRGAARWVATRAQPGDVMAVRSFAFQPLDYYLDRFEIEHMPEFTSLNAALADETPGRLWVVLGGLTKVQLQQVDDDLSQRYAITRQRRFGSKVMVWLLQPRTSSSEP